MNQQDLTTKHLSVASAIAKIKAQEVKFLTAIKQYLADTELGTGPTPDEPISRLTTTFCVLEQATRYIHIENQVIGIMSFYERDAVTNDVNLVMTATIDSLGNIDNKKYDLALSAGDYDDARIFINVMLKRLLSPHNDDSAGSQA